MGGSVKRSMSALSGHKHHHGYSPARGVNIPSTFSNTLARGVAIAMVDSRAAASISARDGPEASGSVVSILSGCSDDTLRGEVALTNYVKQLELGKQARLLAKKDSN